MELGLKGRLALISGGSKGIGLACAKALAAEGVRIVIASRSQDNIDAALAQLPGARGYAVDLKSAAAAGDLVDAVEKDLGAVEILINSAGAAERTPPERLAPSHWQDAMDAKFFTYIHLIDPLIKRMAAHGRGVIVNVIGAGGKVASPIHLPGGAANAALMLATAGLGKAYASQNVRVVGLNPGPTETDRLIEAVKTQAAALSISEDEVKARIVANIPFGRVAQPEDIADVVTFLCSDRAGYVSGVTINMDGMQNAVVV